MAFSFYQSLRTVPRDLEEAPQLSASRAWQRFWRLEVPFAMPGLIWNMMMSMSGGWFFVVAVRGDLGRRYHVTLPGIGSYIALAIEQANLRRVGWAIGAMPSSSCSTTSCCFARWSPGPTNSASRNSRRRPPRSWVLQVLRRTRCRAIADAAVGEPVRALSLRLALRALRRAHRDRRASRSRARSIVLVCDRRRCWLCAAVADRRFVAARQLTGRCRDGASLLGFYHPAAGRGADRHRQR